MAEQVRPEGHSGHVINSSSNKSDKYAIKSRGSGSPFKCIGLGLAQQIKSERDEELSAARLRIEELESLSVTRQKEVGVTAPNWLLQVVIDILHMFILFYNLHFFSPQYSRVFFTLQIFALNAKLAAAESMTHDVIRDLLGVKLDMTTYVVNHVALIINLIYISMPSCLIYIKNK